MKKWRFVYLGAVVSALVVGLGLWSPLKEAVAKSKNKAPLYKVDPFWPKPLPVDSEKNPVATGLRATGPGASKPWVTGEVAGTCIDSKDHLFTINRGPQNNLVSPETVVAHPSPSVIEYDRAGNVVNAWPPNVPTATAPFWAAPSDPVGCDGSPACHGATRGVPTGLHGCFVDYQDNVWVAGNGDGVVQKYSHDGSTLLLQIGTKFVCDGGACGNTGLEGFSKTLLNDPADIAVDPSNGEVYIADGYGNHRVVVFDKTGHYLRQMGGVGMGPGQFTAGDGGHPHCVRLGKDGLVYACDRGQDRINVYTKGSGTTPGTPVTEIPVIPGTAALGTAG